MRKMLAIISTITLTTASSLQITACADNSKFNEFLSAVNSGNAFFGILGAADNDLTRQVITGLEAMQRKINNQPSQWSQFLDSKQNELNDATNNGKIDIKIFERISYGNKPSDVVDYFWNDKSISWQKQIYHWLLDNRHIHDNYYRDPTATSGALPINDPTDKDRKFTDLPIIFIVNKGKVFTLGKKWATITEQAQFFEQFKSLIIDNLLSPNPNPKL